MIVDGERVCANLFGLLVGEALTWMRYARVCPHNGDGCKSRFFSQASDTPLDCSVIYFHTRKLTVRKISSSRRGGKVWKREAFSTFPPRVQAVTLPS